MSPRPAKSGGNSSRSPNTCDRGPTYLSVATLPSSTKRVVASKACERASACATSGCVKRGLFSSMSTLAQARSRSTVTRSCKKRRPSAGLITSAPERPSGALPNASAYVILPRK